VDDEILAALAEAARPTNERSDERMNEPKSTNFSTWMRAHGRPAITGHRGAMGTRPENTLAAFERAAELGAEWVELDVHLAKDGVAVVLHDATLERTTNGKGKVAAHTSKALAKLDAGSWFGPTYAGERVSTLDEVLAWAKARGVRVQIELKGDPVVVAGLPAAVVESARRTAMLGEVLVISFDHRATTEAKGLARGLRTGLLYAARPASPVAFAKSAKADVLIPHASFVTAEDVAALHGAGLAMATWAPSEPKVLRALVAMGVDAITVDHPDVLRRALRSGR